VSNVTCDKCHRYGHATKDCRVQLGAPNFGGVQQVQQNNNKKPKAAGRVFALVEVKLRSLITLLEVFVLSLEHNYLYCLIFEQPIILYLLIVIRNLS